MASAKLARMILKNHWYEVKQTQSEGFFKDLNSSRTRDYQLLPQNLLSNEGGFTFYSRSNFTREISGAAIEVGKEARKWIVL